MVNKGWVNNTGNLLISSKSSHIQKESLLMQEVPVFQFTYGFYSQPRVTSVTANVYKLNKCVIGRVKYCSFKTKCRCSWLSTQDKVTSYSELSEYNLFRLGQKTNGNRKLFHLRQVQCVQYKGWKVRLNLLLQCLQSDNFWKCN